MQLFKSTNNPLEVISKFTMSPTYCMLVENSLLDLFSHYEYIYSRAEELHGMHALQNHPRR